MELFVYVSLFFLLLSVVGASILFGYTQEASQRRGNIAGKLAMQFSDNIRFAQSAGNGFFGVFEFEPTILGVPYNATFGPDGFVRIEWEDRNSFNYLFPLYTKSISGKEGNGVVVDNLGFISIDTSKGYFSLENKQGIIEISQNYKDVNERFSRILPSEERSSR